MVIKRLCPENELLEKRVMNIFGFRDNRCVWAVKRKSELLLRLALQSWVRECYLKR